MRRSTGPFAADTVARDNSRISIQAIHGSMRDTWRDGSPALIAHDGCRPIGWSWPTAIYLEPGRGLLLGTLWEPESREESQELAARYNLHLRERIARHIEEHLPRFRSLLGPHLDGSERPIDTDAVTLVGQGLARRVAPSIFGHEDKDGLVPLNILSPIRVLIRGDQAASTASETRVTYMPGVFRFNGFLLFAHPYFRRNLSRLNPINPELLSALLRLGENDSSVKIRLDPDAVGLEGTAHQTLEYAYWHGPPFSDSLISIPPGVAVYGADDEQRMFSQVSRTEFWWQSRLNKKRHVREHIFEAEELRNQPTDGGRRSSYGCRYVHSIVCEDDGTIEHLDGAIREYNEEQMTVRLDLNIASSGRHTVYTKLWRVDGQIPFGTWKALIYHYYRENPLVGEYLTGQKNPLVEEIREESHKREILSPREKVVPYSMNAGEKVRFSLYYRSGALPEKGDQRWVLPNAHLGTGEYRSPAIDAETMEFRKALRRLGEEVHIPDATRFVSFADRYVALPPVLHVSRDGAILSLQALKLLVGSWQGRGEDRVVSFSLGVCDNDQQVWLSTLGHIEDVAEWLECGQGFPVCSLEGVDAWLEFAKSYLGDSPARRAPTISRLPELDGTFAIVRTRVPPEYCRIVNRSEGSGSSLVLDIPQTEDALKECVASGEIAVRFALLVEDARCPICQETYIECSHSAWLDDATSELIIRGRPIFPFWTDRPA